MKINYQIKFINIILTVSNSTQLTGKMFNLLCFRPPPENPPGFTDKNKKSMVAFLKNRKILCFGAVISDVFVLSVFTCIRTFRERFQNIKIHLEIASGLHKNIRSIDQNKPFFHCNSFELVTVSSSIKN